MITQGIINLIVSIAENILGFFPDISINLLSLSERGISTNFVSYVRMALYFLPVDTIAGIFELMILFMIIRCCVAFLKTLWAILPIV